MLLKILAACVIFNMMLLLVLALHEHGHLLAMRKYRINPDSVTLGVPTLFSFILSGLRYNVGALQLVGWVTSQQYAAAPLGQRLVVALAGPATSMLIGACFFLLGGMLDVWLIRVFGEMNILFGVLNLFPLPPFDGFAVTEWALWRHGVALTERVRKILFGLGMVALAVFCIWA